MSAASLDIDHVLTTLPSGEEGELPKKKKKRRRLWSKGYHPLPLEECRGRNPPKGKVIDAARQSVLLLLFLREGRRKKPFSILGNRGKEEERNKAGGGGSWGRLCSYSPGKQNDGAWVDASENLLPLPREGRGGKNFLSEAGEGRKATRSRHFALLSCDFRPGENPRGEGEKKRELAGMEGTSFPSLLAERGRERGSP